MSCWSQSRRSGTRGSRWRRASGAGGSWQGRGGGDGAPSGLEPPRCLEQRSKVNFITPEEVESSELTIVFDLGLVIGLAMDQFAVVSRVVMMMMVTSAMTSRWVGDLLLGKFCRGFSVQLNHHEH